MIHRSKDLVERIWWSRDELTDLSRGERYFWYLLIPFGVLYGMLAQLRHLLFDLGVLAVRDVGIPTVSVGNLTVGGTGKTPFVESIARSLGQEGVNVAVLSRGYGSSGEDADDERMAGRDMPAGVRRWVDPDRLRAAKQALRSTSPDLFLMDDGFQHRHMHRDLDIVLVDGLRGFGNGYPLPAGPLREPVSQIRRADLVVITRTNRISHRQRTRMRRELRRHLQADVPILHAEHRPVRLIEHGTGREVAVTDLREMRLLAFCGIGTPASFAHTLRDDLNLDPVDMESYPDHHDYTDGDRNELMERAEDERIKALITTRKDAVKWPKNTFVPLYYVDVEVRVTQGSSRLKTALDEVVRSG